MCTQKYRNNVQVNSFVAVPAVPVFIHDTNCVTVNIYDYHEFFKILKHGCINFVPRVGGLAQSG